MSTLFYVTRSLSSGLVAGALAMGTLGPRKALETIEPWFHIRVRKNLIRRLRAIMPITMFAAVTSSLGTLLFVSTDRTFAWRLFSLLCSVAVLAISVTVHSPINRKIIAWNADDPPAEASRLIDLWNKADTIRLVCALGMFLSSELGRNS